MPSMKEAVTTIALVVIALVVHEKFVRRIVG